MDDRGRDGGTNFILRIKEQETRLTLQEHDDDDDDDDKTLSPAYLLGNYFESYLAENHNSNFY